MIQEIEILRNLPMIRSKTRTMPKCFPLLVSLLVAAGCTDQSSPQYSGLAENMYLSKSDTILADTIVYHPVRVDHKGHILPWYSDNLGQSYDHVLERVWTFWKNMEVDSNGMQYYMNHQVWDPRHDKRGLGGDQLNMALSSWDLYYNYTGDEAIIRNMKYMADYYLANSLSPATATWPDLPYPYNMNVESGIYDGDMIIGKGYTQPDKAGSFAFELVHLFKKTGDEKYLNAAIKIANTLASKVQPGDQDNSPWPFKVNAQTGEVGVLIDKVTWYEGMDKDLQKSGSHTKSSYTTFFTGTLNLFKELIAMNKGNTSDYKKAFDIAVNWFKKYPVKSNKWGPFFEDIPRWSDTQINAITFAMFLMENPELDPNWQQTVKGIFEWVYNELGNKKYQNYGVTVIDEQTAYRVPGNSHSARQASMDLMYWEKSGDTTYVRNAVRQLNWATYMVDEDGKNFYPTNAIWMTDGYGDYTRHYLRAMASAPQLAPDNADHLLRSTSIVQKIVYEPQKILYNVYDNRSSEIFRLTEKPDVVKVNGKELPEVSAVTEEGWYWQSLPTGGILKINQSSGSQIEVIK
jgi:hypothetical protein